jgi:hypothetical protein
MTRPGRDPFGLSHRGGRHGLDLPGAQGGVRRARPADEPLHDRGSHYFRTTKAGEIDRGSPTKVGRALEQLGVEPIGAFSPHSPSRDGVLPDALCQRTLGAGLPDVAGPARGLIPGSGLRDHHGRGGQHLHPRVFLPANNARFAVDPAGEGSAFTPNPGVNLDEILCVQEEREVMNDNCVSYRTLKLQIPESPLRPTSLRRGLRSASTPTAPTPASTDPAASADMTRTELGGETLWTAWTSLRLAHAVHRRTKAEEADICCATKTGQLIPKALLADS